MVWRRLYVMFHVYFFFDYFYTISRRINIFKNRVVGDNNSVWFGDKRHRVPWSSVQLLHGGHRTGQQYSRCCHGVWSTERRNCQHLVPHCPEQRQLYVAPLLHIRRVKNTTTSVVSRCSILIIFDGNIPEILWLKAVVLFPISFDWRFCSIWGNKFDPLSCHSIVSFGQRSAHLDHWICSFFRQCTV